MIRFAIALGILLVLSCQPLVAAPRKWTSADGQFSVDAELVKLDATSVTLLKANGTTATVTIERLSAADRQLVKDLPFDATPDVLQFLLQERQCRPLELARIEKRLLELKADLKAGAQAAKSPLLNQSTVAKAAKQVTGMLEQRQRELKTAKFTIPRLNPLDMAVGQIGGFDDDIFASRCHLPGKGVAIISVMHEEFQYETRLPGQPAIWVRGVISRPSSFAVRGAIVANFQAGQEKDQQGPNSKLLRSTLWQVVGREGVGNNVSLFLLEPYDDAELKAWIGKQVKK